MVYQVTVRVKDKVRMEIFLLAMESDATKDGFELQIFLPLRADSVLPSGV